MTEGLLGKLLKSYFRSIKTNQKALIGARQQLLNRNKTRIGPIFYLQFYDFFPWFFLFLVLYAIMCLGNNEQSYTTSIRTGCNRLRKIFIRNIYNPLTTFLVPIDFTIVIRASNSIDWEILLCSLGEFSSPVLIETHYSVALKWATHVNWNGSFGTWAWWVSGFSWFMLMYRCV